MRSLFRGPTNFRYSIDQGVERILYLSGGTDSEPAAIRLTRGGSVIVEGSTFPLSLGNPDVCRNNPPEDARWWSRRIPEEAASAISRGDWTTYRLEALVAGQWTVFIPRDSGCESRGG